MRALITGVPGWLGNRFLEVLVKGFDGRGAVNDWSLRCLVLKNMDSSFIDQLAKIKPVEKVYGDVTQPDSLAEAVKGVDVIFHLVGIIHPQRIRDMYEVNTQGTRNILEAAAAAGVKRFVHVSSNSVCGTNKSRDILMTEADAPDPYLNYGRSKHLAEQAVHEICGQGKLEGVILRPCWYYGPNQPARQTTFFTMIQKGNPLMFGNGKNLRSMSYLDNTIEAMLLAAVSPQAVGQTYWIADEKPYTCDEIYRTVAGLLEVKDYRPRYLPGVVSEMCLAADITLQAAGAYIKEIHVAGEMNKDIACSIEKAKRELGYKPKVALEEGMRRSIDWCRKNGIKF